MGGFTFRAWFGDTSSETAREAAIGGLLDLHAELEWYSKNLLAVHAEDEQRAERVAGYLHGRQQAGDLTYETGRTR